MKRTAALNLLQLAILGTALSLRLASSDTVGFSYLLLAGYALTGSAQSIQALAMSWLFAMLSEGVAPLASDVIWARYLVIAGAALSVLLRNALSKRPSSISLPVLHSLALGVLLIFHSMMFSPIPDLSILRALLWTTVMITLLSAWAGLDYQARERLEQQLFGSLVILVLVSLPLAFTDIGYLRNGIGFQGVLNQSQTFGPVVAIVGAWAAGHLLGIAHPRWRDVAFLGLCFVLVVMSEARTAGMALVLGLASAVLVSPGIVGIPARLLMPGLASGRLRALGLIAAISVVAAGPALSDRLNDFVYKRSDSVGLLEILDSSRGGLVQAMIANIEEEPFTGIGFAIASEPLSMVIDREPILELPISGTITIEKGVLPIAVLEELGVFGFLMVTIWVGLMIRRGAKAGVVAFAVMATLLFTNLGESTLFFPGGLGLLILILLAWAVTGKQHPVQDRARG